jgi:hypothetical protein
VKRAELKRRKPLERGPGPKRSRKPLKVRHRRVIDRQASEAWARSVQAKRCAVCGAAGVQGHHIVYQQHLRRVARKLGVDVDRLLWDKRNALPLCERHHTAHHNASYRITADVLRRHAPKVFQFAREVGLLPWLERTYPAVRDGP